MSLTTPSAPDARTSLSHDRPPSCEHMEGSHDAAIPSEASAPEGARAWLLLEHHGPWPARIEEAPMPDPVRAAVTAAADLGIRVHLIRRFGRRPVARRLADSPMPSPFQLFVGNAGDTPWLERREIVDLDQLRDLDLSAAAGGDRPLFGSLTDEPVLLVCTHGRHNACCARLGRPLAHALTDRHGTAVWETTHVSGDRYAANLVILPRGLYYGPVGPATANAAIDAYRQGRISMDRYRGRSGQSEAVQAAEYHARRVTGLDGLDDVAAVSDTEAGIVGGNPRRLVVVQARSRRLEILVERVRQRVASGWKSDAAFGHQLVSISAVHDARC